MTVELNLATVISAAAVVVILFFAIRHIVREKRRGVRCIGCPMAGTCTKSGKEREADLMRCPGNKDE